MKKVILIAGLALAGIMGCSEGLKEFPVARVKGTLLCGGQPVKMAQVHFEPIVTGKSANPGKAGFDFTDEEGKFVLSTYGTDDGAVVGMHNVRVAEDSKNACDCVARLDVTLKQLEVVADEENEFIIELTKKSEKEKRSPSVSEDEEDD